MKWFQTIDATMHGGVRGGLGPGGRGGAAFRSFGEQKIMHVVGHAFRKGEAAFFILRAVTGSGDGVAVRRGGEACDGVEAGVAAAGGGDDFACFVFQFDLRMGDDAEIAPAFIQAKDATMNGTCVERCDADEREKQENRFHSEGSGTSRRPKTPTASVGSGEVSVVMMVIVT